MNKCLYINKSCKHADRDGECRQGVQNWGWENWNNFDDDKADISDLDLFDLIDEDE